MIKVVHFSDLHFGSGERYGSINPETGLNKRFEDFAKALDKAIDFSIESDVDIVIFTGDTYKHATPEPIYQREFARRIKRLSNHKIPTILLIGNHDILYRIDGSDALDIYSTLAIDHITVFNKIELKEISTKSGSLQIIALPHITKSRLLTKEEYRNFSTKEQDDLMIKKVKEAIESNIQKLNPKLPSILIGHGTIETAQFGSEQDLSIGKVLSYPLGYFKHNELDYVGFGHIHKHQILWGKNKDEKPVILYAGSLERVDFGEEDEEKGFIYLELEKGKTSIENIKFKSSDPRKLQTISCDLTESTDPQLDLETEIKKHDLAGAIIRVRYKIKEEDRVEEVKIKELLKSCFSYVIQKEIAHKERNYRIAELDSNLATNPMTALDKYLFDKSEEDKQILIQKAKDLMGESK